MNCKICSSEIERDLGDYEILMKKELCWKCHYWWLWIECKTAGDIFQGKQIIRANHNHFVVYTDVISDTDFQGFGGRQFKLKIITSGITITTKNLWHQGEIPSRFRKHLPDNAVFLDQRKRCLGCSRRYIPTMSENYCLPCVMARD